MLEIYECFVLQSLDSLLYDAVPLAIRAVWRESL
jgi:hypothetical protein